MTAQQRRLLIAVLATFAIGLLLFGVHQTSDVEFSRKHISIGWKNSKPPGLRDEKLAYAIFLSGTLDQKDDLEEDKYFVAVRIAIWQLLHKVETRTVGIDVIVMVTPSVTESRRALLKTDGAIVYPVELLHVENDEWIHQNEPRWNDVMTKLRVLEMTQYSRILMLDGDTLLRQNLDGIFDDPAAQIRKVKPPKDYTPIQGEAPLPKTYLMAAKWEVHCWHVQHGFPPQRNQINVPEHFNAGFMMFAPSKEMFDYYVSFLKIKDSFDPIYPEQNLLNYVHRSDGPMPWQEVNFKWNTLCPNNEDFEKGIVSAHEKWWGRDPGFGEVDAPVRLWLYGQRWEMKGWYDARNLQLQKQAAEPNVTQRSLGTPLDLGE